MTEGKDCTHLDQIHAFADGELTGEVADTMRDHLAACEACQAELADVLQLDAAVAGRKHAGVISLAWYRKRHLQLAGMALAAAAGVAIFLALPHRGAPVTPPGVAVALAPRRVIEARLAWSGAASHRVYDVPRAGEPPHESFAMRALADLEARGDLHGVGALALLGGERRRAADFLARAGDSADAICDRAALALAEHQPERALALADDALAKQAGHAAALWNRALALRDLGLARTAAAAFRDVAGLGEPGWADEARRRAAALDAESDAVQRRSAAGAPAAEISALEQQADAALAAGDLVDAEAILVRGRDRCTAPDAPATGCVQIGKRLGDLYLELTRVPEARAALSAAWRTARASGDWVAQQGLLASLAALAAGSDDATAIPLLRAFTDEATLRDGRVP